MWETKGSSRTARVLTISQLNLLSRDVRVLPAHSIHRSAQSEMISLFFANENTRGL